MFLLDGERAPQLCAAMARIALGHVGSEYTNYIMHNGRTNGTLTDRAPHPVFSAVMTGTPCVHNYFARTANRFP
ncbi:hypothetical protein BG74_07700 [Sodalis-like endosymbiont of Proechinophthirus fluctus]|nr:hypothetical protein BG74_07700 [Sodalis-like endosymbiont of Proechinophthirus fluctus]